MALLNFEFRKIYREKTTLIIFSLIFLLLIVPFLLGSRTDENIELNLYENNYRVHQNAIKSLKSDPNAEETIKDMEEISVYLIGIIEGIKENDKAKKVTNELRYETKRLDDMEEGKLIGGPIIEQKKSVAVLDFIVSKGMDKKEENPQKMGAINYFEMIFSTSQFTIVFFLLISVYISYLFTLDNRNKSIEIYNRSPYSMYKIYAQKLIAVYSSVIINMMVLFLLLALIILLKNGLGNAGYPIAQIVNNSDVQIISTGSFLFKNLVFINNWIILLSLVSLFFSFLSTNLILNMFVLFLPTILYQYNVIGSLISDSIKPYLLTSYVNISRVILGGDGYNPLPNTNVTFDGGMSLLLIARLVVISLLIVKIRKRNRNDFF